MLADCGMVEFPYKGNPMSWMGYRSSGKVQCRLNRAIGNEEWHHLFFHTNAEYLKLWGSDHGPILIRTQSQTVRLRRSFKFDRRWLDKDGLKEAIEEGWGPREVMDTRPLHIKLGDVRRAISRWKRANLSNTQKKIELIKEQLEREPRRMRTSRTKNSSILNGTFVQLSEKWNYIGDRRAARFG